ncbi:hypothetical protein EJ08DRAFT_24495 [Tothia fuscella]|uniref:Uncharacterized protein n=1 Tax=Tothia fuscella TaxID=1048955 RepID=A0A9P4NGS6_9PEZI|nr:hypothetical protein EJ08DRAFT_24495 [Tothia fuscella]
MDKSPSPVSPELSAAEGLMSIPVAGPSSLPAALPTSHLDPSDQLLEFDLDDYDFQTAKDLNEIAAARTAANEGAEESSSVAAVANMVVETVTTPVNDNLDSSTIQAPEQSETYTVQEPVKRGRGRPKKNVDAPSATPNEVQEAVSVTPKRGPGRPPKAAARSHPVQASADEKHDRFAKSMSAEDQGPVNQAKPTNEIADDSGAEGVKAALSLSDLAQQAIEDENEEEEEVTPVVARGRGRPKGSGKRKAEPQEEETAAEVKDDIKEDTPSPVKKRRGRPPKNKTTDSPANDSTNGFTPINGSSTKAMTNGSAGVSIPSMPHWDVQNFFLKLTTPANADSSYRHVEGTIDLVYVGGDEGDADEKGAVSNGLPKPLPGHMMSINFGAANTN